MLTKHKFLSVLMLTALVAAVALLACTDNGAESATAVPTPTPIPTPTAVPTPTPIPTPTAVPTPTPVPTPTAVPTPTPVPTPTAVPTPTPVPTPTAVPTPEVKVIDPGSDKQTIIFSELNWTSALLQNRIAQYIVEHGYDYPTDVRFGLALPLFEGLQRGDTDVSMEIWLPSQGDAWEKALGEGLVLSPGPSLGSDWQSAFVIPAYLQEQYPGLDSVEDLRDQKYKDLFKTAETGGKARLVSCPIGWECELVNATQVEAYGLSEHVDIANPYDGSELDAGLYGAYELGEPWLGYQWGSNTPAFRLDLVRLEEPPYSDECWATTMACAYQDANVIIAVNSDLPDSAPDVVEMLRQWSFNLDDYKAAVRWQYENQGFGLNATALWWLKTNSDIWSAWVTTEAAEKIQAALDADEEAAGWPGDW